MAWFDLILTLFGVFGLLCLGWMGLGRLLLESPLESRTYAVVSARDDAGDLEQAVRGLLWMRGSGRQRYTVVIADAGLSPAGRQIATMLANREGQVVLCPLERVGEYLR